MSQTMPLPARLIPEFPEEANLNRALLIAEHRQFIILMKNASYAKPDCNTACTWYQCDNNCHGFSQPFYRIKVAVLC